MQEYREAAEELINPRAQTKNRRKNPAVLILSLII